MLWHSRSGVRRTTAAGVLFVVTGIVIAGCLSDAPTGAGAATLDLRALGLELQNALPIVAASELSDPTTPFHSPVPIFSECPYTPAVQSFVCPILPSFFPGVNTQQTVTLYDGAGRTLSSADRSVTESFRLVTTTSGTLGDASAALMSRVEDLTLSGLLEGKYVLNGTTISREERAPTSADGFAFIISDTTRMSDVHLPVAVSSTTWPLSGTVTEQWSGVFDASHPSVTSHVSMMFDGTSFMTLTRASSTGTHTCRIDLAFLTPPPCV